MTMQLHRAVDHGDLAEVRRRLDRGEALNGFESDYVDGGRTVLMIAAESPCADERMIELLLERGADINQAAPGSGKTALMAASYRGTAAKVRCLLDAGVDPAQVSQSGYSAICLAGLNPGPDRHEIVELLAAGGGLTGAQSDYGESAVSVAGQQGDFALVRRLAELGADLAPMKWTKLMKAVSIGEPAELPDAVKEGGFEQVDRFGRTAWMLCLMRGNPEAAQILAEAGGESGLVGRSGQTPLLAACGAGKAAVVRWLLARGADAREIDEYQRTALHYAAQSGDEEVVRVLLEAGADPLAQDHVQDQPIHAATTAEVIEVLMDAGADPNTVSGSGYTVLRQASESRNAPLIEQLLVRGVRDEPQGEFSASALDTAVTVDDPRVVEMLIRAGSDVNREWDDYHPLHRVCSVRVAGMLYEAGANPRSACEVTGDLPSVVAGRHTGDAELVEFLRQHERKKGRGRR